MREGKDALVAELCVRGKVTLHDGGFTLGFGLFHGWLIAMLTYLAMPPLDVGSASSAAAFLGGGVAGALAYVVLPKDKIGALFVARDALVVLASCSVLVAFGSPSALASLVCLLACGLLCGSLHCSYGLALLAFSKGEYVRIISVVTVIASLTASFALLVGRLLPPLWQAVMLVALQVAAGMVLKGLSTADGGEARVSLAEFDSGSRGPERFLRLMVAVFLFDVVSRASDVFLSSTYTGMMASSLALFLSHVIAAAVMLLVMRERAKRRGLSSFYRLALPCAGAGFVVLAAPFSEAQLTSLAAVLLVGAGFEVINLTAWVLTAYAARLSARPSRYFGLYALVTYFAMLTSKLLNGSLALYADSIAAFMGLVCVVVLVTTSLVVLPEDQVCLFEESLRASEESRTEGEAHRARCQSFAGSYGLTEREAEVLELLVRGRTLKVVAERLVISKGTAGTHIANIYRKTDVHKQQDLIDLFEGFLR